MATAFGRVRMLSLLHVHRAFHVRASPYRHYSACPLCQRPTTGLGTGSSKLRWKRCAPLCTAVYRCVCARALVTHAKSLPIPGGELLLPWTTSIPYESHKHHYFQERCQWQLCWLTLVVYTRAPARHSHPRAATVGWWPVAVGPGADISVSRFQSCLQMPEFKGGDVSPSTGLPYRKREREFT